MLELILKKIIKTASGNTKYFLAIFGLGIAFFLILTAVQLHTNFQELLNGKKNKDSIANFLVINKEMVDQNIGASSINQVQLNKIKSQPFIESVGQLTTSRFKASIQSATNILPFYTDIAFESVPENFLDISVKGWNWKGPNEYVPIIIPNQFLDFYNFQYSISQNLPQLSPDIIKMLNFKVNIQSENGNSISLNGRVVGFSNRITSMLVPQEFMDWANSNYSNHRNEKNPSRVIIKTKDAGNPALTAFLKQEGLVTDADKTRFSKYRQIVDFVVQLSGITGGIMLLFAILIFSLLIQLTIASCKSEIELLLLLGYAPKNIGNFLLKQFLPANVYTAITGIVGISFLQYILSGFLAKTQISLSPMIAPSTFLAAFIMLIVMTFTNYQTIKKYLRN